MWTSSKVGARRQSGMDPAPNKNMRHIHPWIDVEDDQKGADRQTASLAALAVVLVLVIVSLMLGRVLRHDAALQDCIISGRTDCAETVDLH